MKKTCNCNATTWHHNSKWPFLQVCCGFYTDTINIFGHTATNENNQDCGVGVV